MHQVRCRVIAPRSIALRDIDFGRDRVTDLKRTCFNLNLMNNQALNRRIGVDNRRSEVRTIRGSGWARFGPPGTARGSDNLAHVADLAAALGIEGRLIEDDLTLIAFTQFPDF